MSWKVTFFIGLLFLISFSCGYAEEFVRLDELIEEALNNSPKIKALKNIRIAEEEKVRTVTTLPDPVFTYGFFGKNIETRVGPQKEKFSLSQKMPFPGKLSLKGKAQAKKAEAAGQMYEAARREVIKDVKVVFYDLYWIDRALEITQAEKRLLEDAASILQLKYEANLKPQQDVLKIEVEISRLLDKLLMLRQRRLTLVARMNSVLSRDVISDLGKIKEIDLKDIALDKDKLGKVSLETRQEIGVLRYRADKAKFEKTLAKFNFLPDFNLGFNYINVEGGHTTLPNDGEDAWQVMLSVILPIWQTKLNAEVKEKDARLKASLDSLENKQDDVEYEVNDLYFKLTTYRDIVSLYDTALIPQATQSFESTQTAYEAGKTDFLNWLDSERTLLKVRLAYYKTKADYAKTLALLERAVGKDL